MRFDMALTKAASLSSVERSKEATASPLSVCREPSSSCTSVAQADASGAVRRATVGRPLGSSATGLPGSRSSSRSSPSQAPPTNSSSLTGSVGAMLRTGLPSAGMPRASCRVGGSLTRPGASGSCGRPLASSASDGWHLLGGPSGSSASARRLPGCAVGCAAPPTLTTGSSSKPQKAPPRKPSCAAMAEAKASASAIQLLASTGGPAAWRPSVLPNCGSSSAVSASLRSREGLRTLALARGGGTFGDAAGSSARLQCHSAWLASGSEAPQAGQR
mmetsp:Transcript_17538/g.45152  ORF Transcript_17538/g.45152 Transcript_17538/m.45152 type:complete len:274 (+) Transcript_17538:421-1242(+)